MADFLKYPLRFLQNSACGLQVYRLDPIDDFQGRRLLLLCHQRIDLRTLYHLDLFARMLAKADSVSKQNDFPLLFLIQCQDCIII